jgi:hypothetical protein
MKILTTDQRSPAWIAARLGRLTGSRAADMMTTVKSGEAAGRRNLRVQLVLERLTGVSQESGYVSRDMQYGLDREADAFGAYEAATGQLAQPGNDIPRARRRRHGRRCGGRARRGGRAQP